MQKVTSGIHMTHVLNSVHNTTDRPHEGWPWAQWVGPKEKDSPESRVQNPADGRVSKKTNHSGQVVNRSSMYTYQGKLT